MGIQNFFKDHPHSLRKKMLPYALYTLFLIAFIRLFFFPFLNSIPSTTTTAGAGAFTNGSTAAAAADHHLSPHKSPIVISKSPPSKVSEKQRSNGCDYANGKWVQDKKGPMYNSTACGTIKKGQNCISHGRPDMGYLYWRWKPKKCQLPRFDPTSFLQLTRDRHVAFVGDSIARNQLESLLCLLATVSNPNLFFTNGEDNKFRKWHFPSHNVNISIYWSPFLVNGIEKSEKFPYNKLYLDSVNDIWAKDLDEIDMIVLSFGHWYLHPAFYYYGDLELGCHYCNGYNFTEIGFYDIYGKALNTTLKALIDKKAHKSKRFDVILTTFSPAHFEGEWDKLGACSKTKPFQENEKKLEGMDYEMRKQEMEQVAMAKEIAKDFLNFHLEALDVTKLALMRPDGHPGPYMNPFPFANGIGERVQNDCVHWCLPGAIDTWNEIMLEIMKRWNL